jgi:hypothetical protein
VVLPGTDEGTVEATLGFFRWLDFHHRE